MKALLLSIFSLTCLIASAQDSTVDIRVAKPSNKEVQATQAPVSVESQYPLAVRPSVYQVVEEMPEFPGGELAIHKFIQSNLVYPDSARLKGIEGRVVVGFVVNADGTLSGFEVKKGVCPDIDTEALRIVKLMPPFRPGKQRGVAVPVQFVLPILFKLQSAGQPKANGKPYDPGKRGY